MHPNLHLESPTLSSIHPHPCRSILIHSLYHRHYPFIYTQTMKYLFIYYYYMLWPNPPLPKIRNVNQIVQLFKSNFKSFQNALLHMYKFEIFLEEGYPQALSSLDQSFKPRTMARNHLYFFKFGPLLNLIE